MKTSLKYFSLLIIVPAFLLSFVTGKKRGATTPATVYDFPLNTLEGEPTSLAKYKGKKLLLVNVASKCGYTPQYKNLQALADQYADKLVVIGFPANNFGGQEPGSGSEIKEFCT